MWKAKWKELFEFSLVCFLDLIVSVVWFLNLFQNRYSSCFCKSDTFFFNIDLTWYWEFITLHNIFNLYGMWLYHCFVPVAIQSVQRTRASHLYIFWTASFSVPVSPSTIVHNFDRGPITSTVFGWSFSKTFLIFCSFVLRFSFKMSLKKSFNFLTLSRLSGTGFWHNIASFKLSSVTYSPKYFFA